MAAKKNDTLKSKELLRSLHEEHEPHLRNLLAALETDIKSKLKLLSMPSYKSRVKDFTSYYRKLRKTNSLLQESNDFLLLTDLIGIRIICPFLEDIDIIENQLVKLYDVVEIEKKGAERSFSEFGYESTHMLIAVPPEIINNDYCIKHKVSYPKGLVCEVQIRTVLQDAWAEVEHELVYKADFNPFDLPMRRKLYSMNATLNLAEIIFQEIRDYQNKLNVELDQRRIDFYEQADVLSMSKIDADSVMNENFSPKNNLGSTSPFVKGTIDDMVLDALQAHNMGNLDKAIAIYTKIIELKPVPNNIILSVIHKHRGMAYFSQNEYKNAKNDFVASSTYDQNNFRAYYYCGIVCSVLNEEKEALSFFDKSLDLNRYQAHVHFRKALSLYNMNLFDMSRESLNDALQHGLSDEESAKLHQLLNAKLT